jgi:hypothetical protein
LGFRFVSDFEIRISDLGLAVMPPYPIYCYTPGCERLAEYKIASSWSDGITGELKTYALSCPECLARWFQRSREKQAACRRAPRETLGTPGIYHLERGRRDQSLERLPELEARLVQETPSGAAPLAGA